ncbi:MAG TPA: alkaline phytoceramidase [Planctomycetota bacterium]
MQVVLARLRGTPLVLRALLLLVVVVTVVLLVAARPPVFQDQGYLDHADQRALLGVPNALDVLSNLPFLLAGWLGFRRSAALRGPQRTAARVAFAAIALVALGSGYYHLEPGPARLLVDRLPISLAFAAIFAWVLGDRLGPRVTAVALWPLLVLSLLTLRIWYGSGALDGDLRPYALVQALPLVALPILIAFFAGELDDRPLALALLLYGLAKLCELLDAPIFALGQVVSGHTLKHLLAAAACLALVPRRPTPEVPPGGGR